MAHRELNDGLRWMAGLPHWARVLLVAWILVFGVWLSQRGYTPSSVGRSLEGGAGGTR